MTVHFKTATINIKSNPLMSIAKVRHDVREASHEAGLIGWQEITARGGNYFEEIRKLGPGWSHYMPHDGGLRIPNPISWNNKVWKKTDSDFIRTHRGLHDVSPNRYITWVRLKNQKTGKEIVRVNTHLVSGAFSGKPHHQWRLDNWKSHMNQLDALVKKFERQGLDVIVGGDFNRDSTKVLGDHMVYDNKLHVGTHGKSTLDYLMHNRHGDLKRTGSHVHHDFFSDHDAVVAAYTLKGPATRGAA